MTPHPTPALCAAALLAPLGRLHWRKKAELIREAASLTGDSFNAVSAFLRETVEELCGKPGRSALGGRGLCAAVDLARRWTGAGVFVVTPGCDIACRRADTSYPEPVWFCHGDASLTGRPSAAIVTSRKPRLVRPGEPWVRKLRNLCRHATSHCGQIVSSYGVMSYNISTKAASLENAGLIVVCDEELPWMGAPERVASFRNSYEGLFESSRMLFLSPFPPGRSRVGREERMRERDMTVMEVAHAVYAADISPGGVMDACLAKAAQRGVPVVLDDAGGLRARGSSEMGRRRVEAHDASCASIGIGAAQPRTPLLVHYTRAHHGPWPGQTVGDYCRSLIEEDPDCGHTALDTLRRILRERIIRGGMGFTRGRQAVVCFTELLPHEAEELFVWRRGLGRWAMEPYGVAAPKDRLIELGAKPVLYGAPEDFHSLDTDERPFFRLARRKGVEMSGEKEWRIKGNVFLDDFAGEDLFVVAPLREQAHALAAEFGMLSLNFTQR